MHFFEDCDHENGIAFIIAAIELKQMGILSNQKQSYFLLAFA